MGITALVTATVVSSIAQPCPAQWDRSTAIPGVRRGYARSVCAWNDGTGETLYWGGGVSTGVVVSSRPLVAKWNAATGLWSELDNSLAAISGNEVTQILPFSPAPGVSRLMVAGSFLSINGIPSTSNLAMWDGSQWLGTGTGWVLLSDASVNDMAVWRGRLYVAGRQPEYPYAGVGGQPWRGLASWDGTAWMSHVNSLESYNPPIRTEINEIIVFDDGSGEALYASGPFVGINGVANTGKIARWNGANWAPVGQPPTTIPTGGISGMTVFDDGSGPALFVTGTQMFISGFEPCSVAKWNGQSWKAVGARFPVGNGLSITSFDDGSGSKLYVGCTNETTLGCFVRWESGNWVTVGGPVLGPALAPYLQPSVIDLFAWRNKLYVGGTFSTVGGLYAPALVAWGSSCSPNCYSNCDGSTAEPVLTANDFACFLDRYLSGAESANCDGSTRTPRLTPNDFLCFVNTFAAGCP